jgi:hypothetical protein
MLQVGQIEIAFELQLENATEYFHRYLFAEDERGNAAPHAHQEQNESLPKNGKMEGRAQRVKLVEFIQLVTGGSAWFQYHIGTENPRVGGSIPSLATSKPFNALTVLCRRFCAGEAFGADFICLKRHASSPCCGE